MAYFGTGIACAHVATETLSNSHRGSFEGRLRLLNKERKV